MLLAFFIFHLSVLVTANPFHRYPFVFLLDVGNEELQKTNTEQIRVSIPGGSVALRYPAIGDGTNTIAHVRVSSIDFGTDLKANIVDGGPGYKYVVLVFMGNAGVPYDAVVTVQTVSDQTLNTLDIARGVNSAVTTKEDEEDANNSAEDLSDDPVNNNSQSETSVQSSNAELIQASSNVYNYAQNEVMDQSDEDNDEENNDSDNIDDQNEELGADEHDNEEWGSSIDGAENVSNEKDIHQQYTDDVDQIDDQDIQGQGQGVEMVDENVDDDEIEISPKINRYAPENYAQVDEPVNIDDSNIYSKYKEQKPEVYYQDEEQQNFRPDYQQQPLDYEDVEEIAPFFNDGEIHNEGIKYKDSNNNNYVDSDDNYAVAY